MRKLIYGSMLMILTASCSKNEALKEQKTGLENTSWKTNDYVAEIVYGRYCYTILEFLDSKICKNLTDEKLLCLPGQTHTPEPIF